MAEFKDVFGFEPAEAAESRRAQQMVVDAMLRNMAHRIATAREIQRDLTRALGKEIGDSASIISFAGGMAMVEQEATNARTAFDEAAKLAKEKGFAVLGTTEDMEVSRIFGLTSIHRPQLSGVEQQRMKVVLEALAAAYYVAEENLRNAQYRRPTQPTQKDIDVENTLEQYVSGWKACFWEAHGVAARIGHPVKNTRDEHLPLWGGYYSWANSAYCDRNNFVVAARAAGLIAA